MADTATEGVYVETRDGLALVHAYINENYGLADVVEVLQYGTLAEDQAGDLRLTLTRKELREVLNHANAFSFDYDEGFVEMCLEIARVAADLPGDAITFIEKLAPE